MATGLQSLCQVCQRGECLATEAYHPLDDIDPVDQFGHPVLDLQAGIDLQKVERLAFGIVDEFDGARTAVVDRLAKLHRRGVQGAPHGIRQVGSRALLEDFLMATLGGAVPLAKGNHLPLAIAEQLHFQMASTGDVGFEKDAAIAEVALA